MEKPDIDARSYTEQEWAHMSYDEKGKVYYLCNESKPCKINAVKILEESITNIANIEAGHNAGSEAAVVISYCNPLTEL